MWGIPVGHYCPRSTSTSTSAKTLLIGILPPGERQAGGRLRGGADADAGPHLEQVGARAGEVRTHLPNVLRGTRNV